VRAGGLSTRCPALGRIRWSDKGTAIGEQATWDKGLLYKAEPLSYLLGGIPGH